MVRNKRKQRVGTVTSNKMNKSITVAVERRIPHPLYGKYVKQTSKFLAHDQDEQCNIGDKVQIAETRPLSKNKSWRLVKILERVQ